MSDSDKKEKAKKIGLIGGSAALGTGAVASHKLTDDLRKGTISVYHGTNTDRAKLIMAKGLVPAKATGVDSTVKDLKSYFRSPEEVERIKNNSQNYVYVAAGKRGKDLAWNNHAVKASESFGGKPVLLEQKVDYTKFKKNWENDVDYGKDSKNAFRSKKPSDFFSKKQKIDLKAYRKAHPIRSSAGYVVPGALAAGSLAMAAGAFKRRKSNEE